MIYTENYNLGSKVCRQVLKYVGVCILIHWYIKFMNINLHNSCKQKDIEICAVKLNLQRGQASLATLEGGSSTKKYDQYRTL